VNRSATTFSIAHLKEAFPAIEFPEYQREPTVWNRDQKQRLLDSILRRFDIAPIYFYERDDGGWECIDGRQRLNAIMSFLGVNPVDEHNGFELRIDNEVGEEGNDDLTPFDGASFEVLDDAVKQSILDYEVITVFLSGSRAPSEFNLQFLRLNLGALINAGEKLHAMVGVMRDLLFESDRLGQHRFLSRVRVRTRRYAHELIAAQVMLEISSKATTGEFVRARHFDLQKYLKDHSEDEDPRVPEVTATLDALDAHAPQLAEKLGNRAICVSVVSAAWELGVPGDGALAAAFGAFVEEFLGRLAAEVEKMKQFAVDARYEYLRTFQRHLTQAAVEKTAVTYRHDTLVREFGVWTATGGLTDD
jgi:hypothetical protein